MELYRIVHAVYLSSLLNSGLKVIHRSHYPFLKSETVDYTQYEIDDYEEQTPECCKNRIDKEVCTIFSVRLGHHRISRIRLFSNASVQA